MSIRFYPTTDIGTLTPEVNAGGGKPFAVIDLGTSGHFSLHDEADLDRLIAAACEAKRMLIAYKSGERHAWQEGSGHYACALCGSLRADAIHDVPKIRYCEVHDTHHDGTGEVAASYRAARDGYGPGGAAGAVAEVLAQADGGRS